MADAAASRWTRRIFDVIGAALATLLAFAVVPLVLLLVVGDPLSGGLGHGWHPLPRDLLCVLAAATWVAWAACCAQLIRGVVARVRSGDVRAVSGGSVVDRLAVRIATGVLALTSVGAPVLLSSGAGASPRPANHAVASSELTPPIAAPTRTAAGAPPPSTESSGGGPPAPPARLVPSGAAPTSTSSSSHVVQPDDTLWGVADQRLDDGSAWTELAALNLGRTMAGSSRFVDPDHLEAGWRLRLSAAAGPARPVTVRHGGAKTGGAGGGAGGSPTGGRLPELVALGLGSLTCAALARRAGRRRRVDPFTSELDREEALSERAVDAATLLGRFDGVPALAAFEAANGLLRRAIEGDHLDHLVRAACVSPHGVTFWLAKPCAFVPDGFTERMEGTAWHVPHEALDDPEPFEPYVPVTLPVGADREGTWLVCLGPGDVLPVLGEAASSLCRSVRTAATAWAWSDSILVTDDPADPRLRSELDVSAAASRHLVFFGDPAALPPGAASRTAVVTTAPVAASGLTLLVDRHGATLHPMGRVVQPYLQTEDTARSLDELALLEERAGSDGSPDTAASPDHRDRWVLPGDDGDRDVGPGRSGRADAAPVAPVGPARAPGIGPARREEIGFARAPELDEQLASALTPGPVEVRLLTMTPRLEGLREDLPPKRARRAVELVAYLALHQPDVITSDRLRTRVLGSSDADAASKTLFNTAHAARRALGVGAHGDPLFPAGTRNGHYQVSAEVTVDVDRAAALAGAARAQAEPEAAIALYRAALDLVEGEPLANALTGYSWWEAEGHGGRIAAVLVGAACSLAVLAADGGHFQLARWGLERARLVEPYSEALSRAAMQLAAAEGDADRLRLEWRDCQRRVDALDPGSAPSSRTEVLYGELRRLVTVDAGGAAGEGSPQVPGAAPSDAPSAGVAEAPAAGAWVAADS